MAPAVYDLDIYQGDTEAWSFSLWSDEAATMPVDLTGFTAAAQIRAKAGAPALLASLAASVELPNIVRVDLDAATSRALPVCRAAAWDLQLTNDGGAVRTVVAGAAQVAANVTILEAVP